MKKHIETLLITLKLMFLNRIVLEWIFLLEWIHFLLNLIDANRVGNHLCGSKMI